MNFVIFAYLLYRFFGAKVGAFFGGRRNQIKKDLEDLDLRKTEADKKLKSVEDSIRNLEQEKAAIIAEAKSQGEAIKAAIIEKATKDAEAMEATDTGKPIQVPVGVGALGRIINVVGRPVDEMGPIKSDKTLSIHRGAPAFVDQNTKVEVLETGIKVVDLLIPFPKGGKMGLFGGAGVGKTVILMELIERLEARFAEMLQRIHQLEEDNAALSAQVESEAGKRKEIQDRIEALLTKVQASLGENQAAR